MYFVTFTVHQWVDVFSRKQYIEILIDSLKFCQTKKGSKIYAWVVMSNHVHLILRSDDNKLSDIIRDFKKYTSTKIVKAIQENKKENRRSWLLWLLKK